MTEKRFTLTNPKNAFQEMKCGIDDRGNTLTFNEVVDMLNAFNDENEQLKSKNRGLQSELQIFKENVTHSNLQINKLAEENEQLRNKKERYKKLSEIRQQQIDNRILTIKEFINNCSDNKVRSTLKELFYSEVNEYDLSSEKRKLLNENEQLKKEKDYYKRELQKELVCQAIVEGRKRNE